MPQTLESFDRGTQNLMKNLANLAQAMQRLDDKLRQVEQRFGINNSTQTEVEKPVVQAAQTVQESTKPVQNTQSQADSNQAALDAIKNIDVNDLGNFSPAATATQNTNAQTAASNINIDDLLNSVNVNEAGQNLE